MADFGHNSISNNKFMSHSPSLLATANAIYHGIRKKRDDKEGRDQTLGKFRVATFDLVRELEMKKIFKRKMAILQVTRKLFCQSPVIIF